MNESLRAELSFLAERQRRLEFWCQLASCWAVVALVGLGLATVQRQIGWSSWVALPVVVLLALLAWAFTLSRTRTPIADWREIAQQIEGQYPELDGRLLTAVQQEPAKGNHFTYLQERLLQEALSHNQRNDWSGSVSDRRLLLARTVHWVALFLLGLVLFELRVGPSRGFSSGNPDFMANVTPGDVSLERGSALVVLARFSGPLPASVEMVVTKPGHNDRIQLVKSLADPMFGATVPDLTSNLTYHVEYAGRSTREYNVTIFEYPSLQRADLDVTYPAYTGEPDRHVENTRRLSAVEGSTMDLALKLNKPVASARLIPRNQPGSVIQLIVGSNQPVANLRQFQLESSKTYDLQLLDLEGRTNKVPAQFVFEALKNRTPEIRLTTPRGDLRPSPLEEITFEGSVWDDFGVTAYGIGYSVVAQQSSEFVLLGKTVPRKQKQQFQYMLRLEDLHLKPDELISWFVWADDLGPDGKVRRTVGDLFFGEIRPFDEVFKEGQGMEGQGQGQGEQSGGGNQTTRLAELQKQIISATWNLQRRQESSPNPASTPKRKLPSVPGPDSRNSPVQAEPPHFLNAHWRREPQTPGASPSPPQEERAGERRPFPSVDESATSALPLGLRRLALVSSIKVVGRTAASDGASGTDASESVSPNAASRPRPSRQTSENADDITVVRDSQEQALEQAKAAAERARDPRAEALWTAATKQMEQALAQLRGASNSPITLKEALAAEQAAYQALLKLQEHEYQVSRQRNRSQSGSSRQQQMERQLEQMELTQTEDRYENQRQAQAPQNSQKREQLQVMNRLQELARRQKDLNDRLKELQSALQEARTEQERQELQRRLKRLQEEEQQMLADVDELRQRMDRPENQSRMADERRQLDQTREDIQRAAEAASEGAASQALASGTRAERQLQEMRDQLRKENSSQFAEDLRSMRGQARELARRQQEIQKGMKEDNSSEHKSLSDATDHKELLEQISRQKELMTNIVDRATQISQQAESSEPLLSSQLYDTVRKFTQDSAKNVQEIQDELLGRGLMPGNLMETLRSDSQPEGAKLLDVASEMLRRDFMPQASQAGERVGGRIEDLKRGVERAAESVLGNDTEALRLAQQELDQLTGQLQNEMAQADQQTGQTNSAGEPGGPRAGEPPTGSSPRDQASRAGDSQSGRSGTSKAQNQSDSSESSSTAQQGAQPGTTPNEGSQSAGGNQGTQASNARPSEQARSGRNGQRSPRDTSSPAQAGSEDRLGSTSQADGGGGGGAWNFDRFVNDGTWRRYGPITGEDFLPWSDRLREVEEVIEQPDLRNEVAAARERARLLRQQFKQDRKKPEWAVVKNQVMNPLTQVRDRIAEELARRQSSEALVPIDRDPVPSRYSELVRRYYEELGKEK